MNGCYVVPSSEYSECYVVTCVSHVDGVKPGQANLDLLLRSIHGTYSDFSDNLQGPIANVLQPTYADNSIDNHFTTLVVVGESKPGA